MQSDSLSMIYKHDECGDSTCTRWHWYNTGHSTAETNSIQLEVRVLLIMIIICFTEFADHHIPETAVIPIHSAPATDDAITD